MRNPGNRRYFFHGIKIPHKLSLESEKIEHSTTVQISLFFFHFSCLSDAICIRKRDSKRPFWHQKQIILNFITTFRSLTLIFQLFLPFQISKYGYGIVCCLLQGPQMNIHEAFSRSFKQQFVGDFWENAKRVDNFKRYEGKLITNRVSRTA